MPELSEGYRELFTPIDINGLDMSFAPNRAYDDYLKIHKVFVGTSGASYLEDIHYRLTNEEMPRYLVVAGSAAVEAALADVNGSKSERLNILNNGINAWRRALVNQRIINTKEETIFTEYSWPYRTAVDIAMADIYRDMIQGEVKAETCRRVYSDCLSIAQANLTQLSLAKLEGATSAVADHKGLGYELNALLAFNSSFSETWFAIPSWARSDNGHDYPNQTHDLSIVQQKWGKIINITPLEVKSRASLRDRDRYMALLVRGKMHLSVPGKYTPDYTLDILQAQYEGTATEQGLREFRIVAGTLFGMVRSYYEGSQRKDAQYKSKTTFQDSSVVAERYPGLVKSTG